MKIIVMKKTVLSFALVLYAVTAICQDKGVDNSTTGKITFEEKRTVDVRARPDAPPMPERPPMERKVEKILLYTQEATLYENGKRVADEEQDMPRGDGMRPGMRMGGGESEVFNDIVAGKITEQREFMNRFFLVEREVPAEKWKLTGKQKTILGYMCSEAMSTDSAGIVTIAWFAPTFPVKGGPALFCNLPGMVLEVSVNNGARSITAVSIEPVKPEELKVAEPEEGKRVTEEEYRAMVAAKMKEMGNEQGRPGEGGGHRPDFQR